MQSDAKRNTLAQLLPEKKGGQVPGLSAGIVQNLTGSIVRGKKEKAARIAVLAARKNIASFHPE